MSGPWDMKDCETWRPQCLIYPQANCRPDNTARSHAFPVPPQLYSRGSWGLRVKESKCIVLSSWSFSFFSLTQCFIHQLCIFYPYLMVSILVNTSKILLKSSCSAIQGSRLILFCNLLFPLHTRKTMYPYFFCNYAL